MIGLDRLLVMGQGVGQMLLGNTLPGKVAVQAKFDQLGPQSLVPGVLLQGFLEFLALAGIAGPLFFHRAQKNISE